MQEGVERGQNTKLNWGRGNSRFWAGPGRTFWALSAFQGQRPLFWAPTHLQTTAGQGVGVGGNESKVQVRGEAQLCWGQVGKVMEKPEDGPGRGGAQETQRQGQKRTGRRREGEWGVDPTETEHSGGGGVPAL